MVRKILCALALLLAAAPFLPAEGALSLDFSFDNGFIRTREIDYADPLGPIVKDPYWGYGAGGSAGLSFKSLDKTNVRGDLSFAFNFPEQDPGIGTAIPIITLKKAFIKARFPWFRLTAGKTRLGWGDGFVFNSGDVIFGSISPYVDLTAREIRSETGWLTAVNVPLGRFSFIEGVVLPPEGDAAAGRVLGNITETSGGGRIYAKITGIKAEAGYFYEGEEFPLHRPYLGLQGNLGIDWYLAASAAVPQDKDEDRKEYTRDTFNISCGLFHLQKTGYSGSMSFRLEGLIMPWGEWEESSPEKPEDIPVYGILLYPEITYLPAETVSLSLRSVFSPVDMSARITAGTSWNVFQGFSLVCFGTFNAGGGRDTFPWSKEADLWQPGVDFMDGIGFTAGVRFIY